MDPSGLAREYVRFGLSCERLLPGVVDCYVGPPELRRRAADEPDPTPTSLAARARWLRAELARSGMAGPRRDFLDRQLVALSCALRRSAGAAVGYRAEVLAYYDTEIALGEPERYRSAHARLAELLPGRGPLAPRLAAHREATRLPVGSLGPAIQRLAGVLRESARGMPVPGEPARRGFGLPADEEVFFEVVSDRPWSAFHSYLGGHRSRVSVNADVELGVTRLARLVAHEAYPGHHAEHVRAEHAQRDLSRPPPAENALFLLNTPQCLLSEGQADLGLEVLVGPDHGEWLAAALDGLVCRSAAELGALTERALRVERAVEALLPVRQDAALLRHDLGRSGEEVIAHLRRWLLVDDRRARQMLRFIEHPRWRTYTTTYVEGRRLVRAWLDAGPAGDSVAGDSVAGDSVAGDSVAGDSVAGDSVTQRYLQLRDRPRSPSALRAQLAG